MRKAFVVLSILACLCVEVFAHGPQEGCTAIMGSFGFMLSKTSDEYSKKTISFAPGINYFVRDNFSIGGRLELSAEIMRKVTQKTSNEVLGFGRYYFTRKVMGIRASLFLEANASYITAKVKPISSANQTRAVGLGVLAGFAIFPTESIGLEFSLPNLAGFYYATFQNEFAGSRFKVGPSGVGSPKFTVFFFIN